MISRNIFIEDCTHLNIEDTVYELKRLVKINRKKQGLEPLNKTELKKEIWDKYCDPTLKIKYGNSAISVTVNLAVSATNFNGSRFYYCCPTCNLYVRKLYSPNPEIRKFLCRNCHKLNYYIQNASKSVRSLGNARYRSYRKKLDNIEHSLDLKEKRLSINRRNRLEYLASRTVEYQNQFLYLLKHSYSK